MSIRIMICSAHEDKALLKKLVMHLQPLQRKGMIDIWYEQSIRAGIEREKEINEQMNIAQIILLLVSAAFITSDYCDDVLMKRIMKRHEYEEVHVIPVVLDPVYWQAMPFGKLQAVPKDARPISTWRHRNEAFLQVAEGIVEVVDHIYKENQKDEIASISEVSTSSKAKMYSLPQWRQYFFSHGKAKVGIIFALIFVGGILIGLHSLYPATIKPGGGWISPIEKTVGHKIHFSAYAYPSHASDPPIAYVNFTAYWPGIDPRQWVIACVARKPVHQNIFACDADLNILGAVPGEITVSFDVWDKQGNHNNAPGGKHVLIYSP